MTPDEQQILLVRLAQALHHGMITVELVNKFPGQPQRRMVRVLQADSPAARPTITVQVRDYQRVANGPWLYWWFWWHPIRSVKELGGVTNTFCDVVLIVAGKR